MIDNVAMVSQPDACDYSSVCQEICPTEAISLTYEIIFNDAEGEKSMNENDVDE